MQGRTIAKNKEELNKLNEKQCITGYKALDYYIIMNRLCIIIIIYIPRSTKMKPTKLIGILLFLILTITASASSRVEPSSGTVGTTFKPLIVTSSKDISP